MWTHRAAAAKLIGIATALSLVLLGVCFAAAHTNVRFLTAVRPAACPAGTAPAMRCFRVTGRAIGVSRAQWRTLDRIAFVGGDRTADVPPRCIPATTRGRLTGPEGTVRFFARGYFCPRTERAQYRYRLAHPSRASNLARRGLIVYDGHSNIERFTP